MPTVAHLDRLRRARGRRLVATAALGGAALALIGAGAASAGSAPSLSWSPATGTGSYAYGTIDTGTNATRTFTLHNSGGSATSALRISLTGSGAFSVVTDTCTGTSLGPRKTCTVTVRFAPTTPGEQVTATLTATSRKPAARAAHGLGGAATAPVVVDPTFSVHDTDLVSTEPRFCQMNILVDGLAPSTGYTAVISQTPSHRERQTFRSGSTGFALLVTIGPYGAQLTVQIQDAQGNDVGKPSPVFTHNC